MKDLTPGQQRALLFIAHAIEDGLPPTMREIALHFGSNNTNSAATYTGKLIELGLLARRGANISRNLMLTEPGRERVRQLRAVRQLA